MTNKLCDNLFSFFSYLLDNEKGITKELIIGNLSSETEKIIVEEECIKIGSKKFIEIIQQMKMTDLPIETIFTNELNKQATEEPINEIDVKHINVNEMEGVDLEACYSTSFLQMNQFYF